MLVIKAINSNRYVKVAESGKNRGRFEYVNDLDDATTFTNSVEAMRAYGARERSLGIDIGRGVRTRKRAAPLPKDAFGLMEVTEEEKEVVVKKASRTASKNY